MTGIRPNTHARLNEEAPRRPLPGRPHVRLTSGDYPMTSPQLIESECDGEAALELDTDTFSSEHWLLYFRENKVAQVNIHFPNEITVGEALRAPLLRSLQRFQIGETGEGRHLKKYASTIKDRKYEQCIDLFIKEEQFHASVLSQMIQSMDGTLLSWHWSEMAFVGLRRMLGLKTEIFILLIAEIIGKCFYRACADNLENERLSDAFSLIVLDEIGHLEFHCSFMRKQMQHFPRWARRIVHACWSVLFFTACMVFIADHRPTLKALNVQPRNFLQDCSRVFDRAVVRTLSL
jgi:hypothetical protein